MEETKKPRFKLNISNKAKAITALTLILLVTGELVASVWAFNLWSKTHTIQSPLRNPIIEIAEAKEKPELKPIDEITGQTKLEVIREAGFAEPIEKMWKLESSEGLAPNGHHQDCNRIGKTNDFGYFKGGNRNYCFNSFEESVQEVDNWLGEQLQRYTLGQALCYYNTGLVLDNCEYYENYQTL